MIWCLFIKQWQLYSREGNPKVQNSFGPSTIAMVVQFELSKRTTFISAPKGHVSFGLSLPLPIGFIKYF